jgi:tetrahydromethanopterin S-methyltransferase subunit G
MANDTDKMSQQLDAQLLELEQRFNNFMKELEEDFNFVPSAIVNQNDNQQKIDDRLKSIEKRYDSVDKKYTILLCLTGAITIGIFVYLGYLLFG